MQDSDRQTFLSFSSGSNDYVIPIHEVVYITESSALRKLKVPSGKTVPNQVFDFNGEPSQLIQLSEVFHQMSRVAESQSLIALFGQRQQDHIDWMDALARSINGDVPFEKATDPHQCAFGKWYDSYQSDDADLTAILAKFDTPHKTIHALAEKLLTLASQGEEARKHALLQLDRERGQTLKGLLQLFGQAKSRLEDMAKPITIIVASEGMPKFGIEVDSIGEVIDFSGSDWMPASHKTGVDSQCFSGFFQGENQLYISFDLQSLAAHVKAG